MPPTRTGRGPDAVECLRKAIAEAERLVQQCGLTDLRADRGRMDIVRADGHVIGQAAAPIAIVSDNGSCFRGEVFTSELAEHNRGRDGQADSSICTAVTSPTATHSRSRRTCSASSTTTSAPHHALGDLTPRQAYLNGISRAP